MIRISNLLSEQFIARCFGRAFRLLTVSLFLFAGLFSTPANGGEWKIDYHADIAPILRDYCSGCHNETDYEGDFSVETYAALMKGGETEDETMIVPGSAERSFLMRALNKQTKPAMPPKKEPQPQSEELALIEKWVNQGGRGPRPEEDHSLLATLTVPHIEPKKNVAKSIAAAEFSPDGKILAEAGFGGVDLVEVGTGKVLKHLPNQDGAGKVNAIHFSGDGKQLIMATGISGIKGFALVWSVATASVIREIGGDAHRDILFDAEFSPDGKWIATAGYDRVIRLWERNTGKLVRDIPGHNGAVFDLAFSPDSRLLASASGDETGKIWRVDTGKRLDTLNQPSGEQFAITFTPDGKEILAAGADNRIRMWRVVSRDKPRINPLIQARFAHEDEIVSLAITADGKWLASSSADRTVKLWKLPMLTQARVFPDQSDLVSSLAFSPVGGRCFFAGRMDGSTEMFSFDERDFSNPDATGSSDEPDPVGWKIPSGQLKKVAEKEAGGVAQRVSAPVEISGSIARPDEKDFFRFAARKGEQWILEVNAAQSKSPLDSKVEVLTSDGGLIERVAFQSVRDSWFTFRGRDSDQVDSFRLQNWREMELNEYLYANGEVIKLWSYPRGPDSGFRVYPGFGKRYGFFGTTPLAHFLGEPCYIVRPLKPGAKIVPNGLPVYHLYYENDDDPRRLLGSDSKLVFVAPQDGEYLAAISDVRGFGGKNFSYHLMIRPPHPGFTIEVGGMKTKISPGGGKELEFKAKRVDGFDGEIAINISNLPPGYSADTPVVIEAGQERAYVTLRSDAHVKAVTPEQAGAIRVAAVATVRGKKVVQTVKGGIGEIQLGKAAKLLVNLEPDGDSGHIAPDGVLEFHLNPAGTVKARVKALRNGFEGDVKFGTDDSGRNLPHGVFVDNIGLNGLMIPANQNEQQLFITAAKWVPEMTRMFHLRTTADGEQVTQAVRLVIENQ